jgi:mono/diheme cytochrome c family protein
MPYAFYKVFTENDLNAVVTYLKSVPAVKNAVERPVYKAAMHPLSPPGADKAMTEADFTDPLKHGFYLATIGHCMECHTPTKDNQADFANMGKGGREFKGPWGVVYSRNITSDNEKGIGSYSDADIKRAITQGIRKDGTKLTGPMGFPLYATMTQGDLSDLVAYLRTVPPRP